MTALRKQAIHVGLGVTLLVITLGCGGTGQAGALRGGERGVRAVAIGNGFACALRKGGRVYCWGDDSFNHLGYKNAMVRVGFRAAPHLVEGLPSAQAVIAAADDACAVITRRLYCWGNNGDSYLHNGVAGELSPPAAVHDLENVQAASVGVGNICAVVGGAAECWGTNADGEVGDGTLVDRFTPTPVKGLMDKVWVLATDNFESCAVTATDGYCWGYNGDGELGHGTRTSHSPLPLAIKGIPRIHSIAIGAGFACALASIGRVKCWGLGSGHHDAYLGNGSSRGSLTPVFVSGLRRAVQITSGGLTRMCALTRKGRVYCWGANPQGILGDGTKRTRLKPALVKGLPGHIVSIATGQAGNCAVTASGQLWCWAPDRAHGGFFLRSHRAPVQVSGFSS